MSDSLPPPPDDLNALPPGTRFGELEILRLLGAGGFGIVYLGQDHALERMVAIKEYMPGQLAQRGQNSQVSVRSGSMRETFELGLRSFVNEARLLARFDHRSLLKVYRFWEANNTAYMAMPYLQGQTLKQWRDARGSAPEAEWLLHLLKPLLEGLGELHAANVYHRDIAPDNIFLPADGSDPILLDFGAARRAIGDRTQSFTAILKPSYAPLEQYDGANALKQGPWTDLYALGAVLYHLIVGHPPPAATRRALADEYQPLGGRELPGYPPAMLTAIDWALSLRPMERPQSVGEFREALLGQRDAPLRAAPAGGDATVISRAMAPTVIDDPAVTRVVTQPMARSLPPPADAATAFEPTQLVTAQQPRFDSDLTAPSTQLPPAVASTLAMPSPSMPPAAPAPRGAAAPALPPAVAATPLGRRGLWMPLGLLAAVGLLIAFWLVLRDGRAPAELQQVADAASAAASASPLAPPANPPMAQASSEPATALAQGESFVDPLPKRQVETPPPAVRPARTELQPPRQTEPRPAAEPPKRETKPNPQAQDPVAPPPVRPPGQASLPQAVTQQDPPGTADPEAACGNRVFIAKTMCIDRKCREPAHAQHPECVRLREIREQRERGN